MRFCFSDRDTIHVDVEWNELARVISENQYKNCYLRWTQIWSTDMSSLMSMGPLLHGSRLIYIANILTLKWKAQQWKPMHALRPGHTNAVTRPRFRIAVFWASKIIFGGHTECDIAWHLFAFAERKTIAMRCRITLVLPGLYRIFSGLCSFHCSRRNCLGEAQERALWACCHPQHVWFCQPPWFGWYIKGHC